MRPLGHWLLTYVMVSVLLPAVDWRRGGCGFGLVLAQPVLQVLDIVMEDCLYYFLGMAVVMEAIALYVLGD